jgi:DNA-binding response OmpR family regulator
MIPHPGAAQATCSQGRGRATGRILVVGNDPTIRSLISRALAAAGYVTDLASTGTEGLRRAPECHYDLIILDLLTADPDGPLAWGRIRIREQAHPHGEVITVGQLSLDLGRLTADTGHGPVPLTRLEFLVLRELAEHAGQPVPKSELLSTVWGYEFDPGSNVVDVCVRRLRSKLGFDLIKTVRGEGYQLAGQLPACGSCGRCGGTRSTPSWPGHGHDRRAAAAGRAGLAFLPAGRVAGGDRGRCHRSTPCKCRSTSSTPRPASVPGPNAPGSSAIPARGPGQRRGSRRGTAR